MKRLEILLSLLTIIIAYKLSLYYLITIDYIVRILLEVNTHNTTQHKQKIRETKQTWNKQNKTSEPNLKGFKVSSMWRN